MSEAKAEAAEWRELRRIGGPTCRSLTQELVEVRDAISGYAPEDITEPGEESPGVDVRLQVQGGGWYLHSGDAQYDQDHRGWWGTSWLRQGVTREELRCVARDLRDQVLDHYYMEEVHDA